jgi:hypothetical protein
VITSRSLDIKEQEMLFSIGKVCFLFKLYVNYVDPNNPQGKPDFYIYKLIETLLPKAMVDTKNYPHITTMIESFEKCP